MVALFAGCVVFGSLVRQSWPLWIILILIPAAVAFLRSLSMEEHNGSKREFHTLAAMAVVTIPLSLMAWRVTSALFGNQSSPTLFSKIVTEGGETRIRENFPVSRVNTAVVDVGSPILGDAAVWLSVLVGSIGTEIAALVVFDPLLLLIFSLGLTGTFMLRRVPFAHTLTGATVFSVGQTTFSSVPSTGGRFLVSMLAPSALMAGLALTNLFRGKSSTERASD